jgi:hypothetical protein
MTKAQVLRKAGYQFLTSPNPSDYTDYENNTTTEIRSPEGNWFDNINSAYQDYASLKVKSTHANKVHKRCQKSQYEYWYGEETFIIHIDNLNHKGVFTSDDMPSGLNLSWLWTYELPRELEGFLTSHDNADITIQQRIEKDGISKLAKERLAALNIAL